MDTQPTPLPLEAGLEAFTAVYMAARNFSPKTRKAYRLDIRQLIEHLETHQVRHWQAVELKHLQGYLAELDKQQLAASTRRRKTYAVKSLFNFLEEHGHVLSNPARRLIPPKKQRKDPRFLSETEYNKLLAQITKPRDKAIVMLFLQTGIRLSELVPQPRNFEGLYPVYSPLKIVKSGY